MSSFAPPPQGQPQGQPHHQPQYAAPVGQPYQQPMAPQPPVKRKRHWKAPTFIGIGAFVIGILIGGAGGSGDPSPTVTVTADGEAGAPVTESQEYKDLAAERDALQKQVDDAAAAAAQAEAPAGLTNGMYIVGTDLEPGRYSMVGQDSLAYVDQKDGDDFLVQEVAGEGETIIVDIADVPGSLVSFSGVTQITKVG